MAEPTLVPAPAGAAPGHGWEAIALSATVTLALRTDGSLWAWGQGEYGLFGDGWSEPHVQTVPALVPMPAGAAPATRWTTVAAGDSRVVALRSDGTLWTWGDNRDGRLGTDYGRPQQPVPARIGVLVPKGRFYTLSI